MSIFSLIKRAPKRLSAIVVMIAIAVILPASLHAWGPSRDTNTVNNPATKVTFDSMTDNPNYGDERNFVTIKPTTDTSAGGWTDDVTVQNNGEYYVRAYVHNDAATTLNLVANDVTAKFNLPTYSANSIQVDGYIDSSNADPTEVYDQAVFHGAGTSDFQLQYEAGSATYTNNVFTNGTPLPDSVVSTGATLGYDKMDGKIPGCFQYAGYVIFKVKAVTSDFSVQKTVRLSNSSDTTFKESVAANPGDKVDYQVYFQNTGGTQLTNVVLKDTLPAGVTYVPNTTYLHTSNGTTQVGDGITSNGLNIGGFVPNGDAYVKFTAQVNANVPLTCGPNDLKNTVEAITTVGNKSDTADVIVNKTCTTTPTYTCTALTTSLVSGTEYKFNGSASASNGASIVSYVFNFGDGKSQTVTNPLNVLHTYATTSATYAPSLTVNVKVNGVSKTVTSAGCTTTVTVGTPPPPPVTPPLLPHTGPTDNIVAFLGLGALIASIIYYVRSRRVQA